MKTIQEMPYLLCTADGSFQFACDDCLIWLNYDVTSHLSLLLFDLVEKIMQKRPSFRLVDSQDLNKHPIR